MLICALHPGIEVRVLYPCYALLYKANRPPHLTPATSRCAQLSVREGRVLRTRTIDNDLNPKWNQSFNLLVDDLDTQSLRAISSHAACSAFAAAQATRVIGSPAPFKRQC